MLELAPFGDQAQLSRVDWREALPDLAAVWGPALKRSPDNACCNNNNNNNNNGYNNNGCNNNNNNNYNGYNNNSSSETFAERILNLILNIAETRSRTMWTTMRKQWWGDLASLLSLISADANCHQAAAAGGLWDGSKSSHRLSAGAHDDPLLCSDLLNLVERWMDGWMGPNNGWHLFRPPPPPTTPLFGTCLARWRPKTHLQGLLQLCPVV